MTVQIPQDTVDSEVYVKTPRGHSAVTMDPWTSSTWRKPWNKYHTPNKVTKDKLNRFAQQKTHRGISGGESEVNEIIEDIWGINWQPPHTCKMVTSDLVYSPAQVTEHRCMELKDQSISEDTKRKFKELKEQFPKVFSLSNEDIGCTQLVTMDINIGDSPPSLSKTIYLAPQTL